MSDKNGVGVHWSFWAIAGVTLIWNLMGVINFIMQMKPETLASMPESHRMIAEARPLWASASFAIAVFGGALGCILLLAKRSAAFELFVLSLLAMIVTMVQAFGVMSGPAMRFSGFEMVLAVWMPLLMAAFLIWYSKYAQGKGWTN